NRPAQAEAALKASRKPSKLQLGEATKGAADPTTSTRPRFNQTFQPHVFKQPWISSRPGYVSDDGPRNKAPGHADSGVARRDADRPARNVLVSQPRRLARGGRGADPRGDRAGSGHQGQRRRLVPLPRRDNSIGAVSESMVRSASATSSRRFPAIAPD